MISLSRIALVALLLWPTIGDAAGVSCVTKYSAIPPDNPRYLEVKETSVFKLVASAEQFVDRRVSFTAVGVLLIDRLLLYPTKEYYLAGDQRNAIEVQLPKCMTEKDYDDFADRAGSVFIVRGMFSPGSFFVGRIRDTELIAVFDNLPEPKPRADRPHSSQPNPKK
jgi:hypothetical protein